MSTATPTKPPIAPEDTAHMLTTGDQDQHEDIASQVDFDRFASEPYEYTLSRHPKENQVVEGTKPQTFIQAEDHPATFDRMKAALHANKDAIEAFEKAERKDAIADLGAYVTEKSDPDHVTIYGNDGEPAQNAAEVIANQELAKK